MDDQTLKILVFAALSLFLILFILGTAKKIVVYYDGVDMALSMAPLPLLGLTGILMAAFGPQGNNLEDIKKFDDLTGLQITILILGILSFVGTIIWSFKNSISYNRSVLGGLIIGVFKLVAAPLGLLVIFGFLDHIFDKKTSIKDAILSAIFLSFFIWLGKQLINGPAVYQRKGWSLPGSAKTAIDRSTELLAVETSPVGAVAGMAPVFSQVAQEPTNNNPVAPVASTNIKARMAGGGVVKQPSFSLSFEEDLMPIFEKYIGEDGFKVSPDIDEKKLQEALLVCQIPDFDQVAAMVLFPLEKDALVMGLFGAYYFNSVDDVPGRIFYNTFSACSFAKKGWFAISIDAKRELDVSGCSMDRLKLVSLLQDIKNVCRQKMGGNA